MSSGLPLPSPCRQGVLPSAYLRRLPDAGGIHGECVRQSCATIPICKPRPTTCTKTHVAQRTALPPQPEHAMHQSSCCAVPCFICASLSTTTHAATHCMYTSVRVHCSDAHTHLQVRHTMLTCTEERTSMTPRLLPPGRWPAPSVGHMACQSNYRQRNQGMRHAR